MLPIIQINWPEWEISGELPQLFLLKWEETFAARTLDTWRPRVTDLPSLVSEVIDSVETAFEDDGSKPNTAVIIEEALQRVQFNAWVGTRFPSLVEYLQAMKDSQADLSCVLSLARLAADYLSSYSSECNSQIESYLNNDDGSPKEAFYGLCIAHASRHICQGYSPLFLRSQLSELKARSNGSFLDRFRMLTTSLNGTTRKYRVRFVVNWPADSQGSLPAFDGLRLERIPSPPSSTDDFAAHHPGALVAVCEVNALDPQSAVAKALEKFADVASFFKIHSPSQLAKFRGSSFGVSLEDGAESELSPAYGSSTSMLEMAVPVDHEELYQTIRRHASLNAKDAAMILAALHHHELAIHANSATTALVNLWIAIEAITQHGEGSKIDKVSRFVVPSIASDNPGQVIAAIARDVSRVWFGRDKGEYMRLLGRPENTRELGAEDLLNTLRDTEEGSLINALYSIIGEHVLMRYRIHRYRTGTLSTLNSVDRMLRSNEANIEWQLRRIYRMRNDIVHRGRSPKLCGHLVRHLHSYFHGTVRRVLRTLIDNPGYSLRDSLEYQRHVYRVLLQSCKSRGLTREAFLAPDLLLTRGKIGTAW